MNKKHEPGQKHPVGHAKNSIPGKVRVHPHTAKALKAVSINGGIKSKSVGGTNNGLKGADTRY